MSDIQVGEYIRTKDGIIAKVLYQDCLMLDCDTEVFDLDGWNAVEIPTEYIEEYVRKHSFNIIDLIEKGDIVNGDEVLRVGKNSECINDISFIYLDDRGMFYGIDKEEIKTILTHEMYERNCYKVVE